MIKYLFTVCFWLPVSLAFAQNYSDSLKIILRAPSDTLRVIRLNGLASRIREIDSKVALQASEKALALSDSLHYPLGQALASDNIGWIYYRRADFSAALDYTTRSLSILHELKDWRHMAMGLNNLAAIHVEQKNFRKAITIFREALSKSIASHYNYGVERSYNNLAYVYLQLGLMDSLRFYAQLVLNLPETSSEGFTHRVIGEGYMREKRYALAEAEFKWALVIARNKQNRPLEVSVLYRLGGLYQAFDRPQVALQFLDISETLCRQFAYRNELSNTYRIKADVYADMKAFERSAFYSKQYALLSDSLYNEESARQLSNLVEKYQNEITRTRLDLLTKESLLQENEILWGKIKLYGVVTLLVIVMVSGLFLNQNYRKIKHFNVELAGKNIEIQEQQQELQILNATKDKLLSIVGHDIRGPVNSMKGMLDLLGAEALTKEELKVLSLEVSNSFQSLSNDLDNLLHWSKTQMGGMKSNHQLLPLLAVTNEIIELFANQAKQKDVALNIQIEGSIVVRADKDQLKIILRNLVSNAIKFTHSNGSVIIGAQQLGNQIKIFVSDNGVGISSEQIEKLFNPTTLFTSPGTAKEKGSGLGLLLVKDFIELNQGSIKAESEPGKGTTFTFYLPSV